MYIRIIVSFRPVVPTTTPAVATPASSKPPRIPASTPMHNSTMMPGVDAAFADATGDDDEDEAMALDFSQIEAIEDDEALQRTLEESLNMSKKEEEDEESMVKEAIEASLREVCVYV